MLLNLYEEYVLINKSESHSVCVDDVLIPDVIGLCVCNRKILHYTRPAILNWILSLSSSLKTVNFVVVPLLVSTFECKIRFFL